MTLLCKKNAQNKNMKKGITTKLRLWKKAIIKLDMML